MTDFREALEALLSSLATGLMVTSFLASLVFVIQYQVRTRGDWRLSQTGRNIMVVMVAVTLILFSVCLSKVLGPYHLQVYIQVLAYGTATVVITQRNFIFDALQRRGERRRRSDELSSK